jgi:hypothetical protein
MAVIIMGKILSGISKTGLIGLTPENGAFTQLFAVASEEFTQKMSVSRSRKWKNGVRRQKTNRWLRIYGTGQRRR